MAVDAQYLYYSLKGDGIYRLPKTGGAAVRIATDGYVDALVATGNGTYWSNGYVQVQLAGAVRKLVPERERSLHEHCARRTLRRQASFREICCRFRSPSNDNQY